MTLCLVVTTAEQVSDLIPLYISVCCQLFAWMWHSHNNNNNNNIVICKVHKVSSNAESEAPAVARWAALVGYAKRTVLRWRLKVSEVGESLVSRG